MTRPRTTAISPFFIVSNVDRTIAFYREKACGTDVESGDEFGCRTLWILIFQRVRV
jgi:hypothetical protein